MNISFIFCCYETWLQHQICESEMKLLIQTKYSHYHYYHYQSGRVKGLTQRSYLEMPNFPSLTRRNIFSVKTIL